MAFEHVKERQAFVWGNAPFENVADSLAEVHAAVVEAAGSVEGESGWMSPADG